MKTIMSTLIALSFIAIYLLVCVTFEFDYNCMSIVIGIIALFIFTLSNMYLKQNE